ncbi:MULTISPECIES: competence pheromone ComX [unclassified Lysinibacillus]|uniref:competence pheromone ComX n=1 Tax=unclassified Lysinibacillus TaxID=2636778 RepID=UPI0011671E36|nr:competence pheromone ComX [Lysinibacillus sp. CD3-6]QPQ36737.1 competence pheromone ComX [Lysinibacillus sp. JNUCC-52]UED81529.1 competence pheromone ComX [Lysinibacillus sp. CD3-6]
MLEITQYLQKNRNILDLLKENKISLLNINEFEKNLILESFEQGEKKVLKNALSAYWRA